MNKKISLILFACNIFITSSLYSKETQINYNESFLEALEEATDIATRTKLNIDHVPAFISILRSDELEKYGFENLYEALSIIPGVELSIESAGVRQVIFRGVKEKGKVKLLIDNISVNNSYRGSIYSFFDFPIELIERIEVIRGPGAVIYGSNAISGVINVITKKNNLLFSSYGSYNTRKIGFSNFYNLDKYKLIFNGYSQKGNKTIDSGTDAGGNIGKTDEEFTDYSVGINLNSENIDVSTRVKNSNYGAAFGLSNYLEQTNDMDGISNKSIFSKIVYKNEITNKIKFAFSIGYDNYIQDVQARTTPSITNGDVILDSSYKEKKFYSNYELFINSFQNHQMLIGVGYEKSKPYTNEFDAYYANSQTISSSSLLKSGVNREIVSLYFDDAISINNQLDLSVGLRMDKYSDFGDALSPRIALVYNQNESLNYKLMYSKAFRAPSFVELYADTVVSFGNEFLDKEESNTIEAGIIYDISQFNTLKVNIYDTKIDNIIYRNLDNRYIQSGYQEFKGIESEFISNLSANSNLSVTFSFIRATENDDNDVANIANNFGNIKYSTTLENGISSATLFKYVGKRKRFEEDNRDDLDSYHTFNQSFSYKYKKYTTTVNIKNIFNESVYYPSAVNTYLNDYPREGRNYSIQFSMEF